MDILLLKVFFLFFFAREPNFRPDFLNPLGQWHSPAAALPDISRHFLKPLLRSKFMGHHHTNNSSGKNLEKFLKNFSSLKKGEIYFFSYCVKMALKSVKSLKLQLQILMLILGTKIQIEFWTKYWRPHKNQSLFLARKFK